MRAGVNDAIGATKEEKMVSSATESVGRTRMLAAKLGKTLSGRFDPIGGQEAVAPLPHAKAPSNQSSSSAARIEVEVDDSRTSNSSSLDNSALLSRPVIRRGRRRGHTAAAAQARKNGMVKIKSVVRLSMRKSRTESATRKISDAETPPQASPVAKKANEKEVDIVEGKLDVTASPSPAAIHASVENVIDASKDGIDSPRASSPVRHDSSDSLEFDDSSDVDGEKGEAMDAVSECSHIDLGEDDKSKAGEMMSVGEDDVEADKKVTGKKDEPNESEEGNKIEDDDDEDGAGEEAKLDEVPSSDVFDEAKHVVPKESEVEFLELNIEFKSGTLGFTFSRGAGDQASAIVVTKVKEGTQAFGKVAVGDIILKIGDASVADGAESAKIVADLIKKTPRPVTLTFKRSLKHLLTKIDPRVVSVSRESIRLKDAHVLDLFKGGDAPREVGEYDIEYTKDNVGFDADSSPLGLRVSVSSKKLSKKMAALEQRGGVGRVFAGDYVLSVANVPAIALPKARYSKIVDEAPRPLKMRFRRAIYHELKLPSFEVTIGGAMSLGGEVLQSKNFQGVMIITNLSMAGALMMSGSVREGDWLVSINGNYLDGKSVKAVNKLLRSVERPVSLVFSRPLLGSTATSKHMSVMRRPDEFSMTTPVVIKGSERGAGMTLCEIGGKIAVKSIKRRSEADKGKVQKGDVLIAIGDIPIPGNVGIAASMIDQSPRPLTLMFERLAVCKVTPSVERKSAWFEKGRLGFRLQKTTDVGLRSSVPRMGARQQRRA